MLKWFVAAAFILVAVESPAQTAVFEPGNGVQAPRVIRKVRPVYPASAERDRRTGTVLLDCVVGAEGTVSDVVVKRSSHEDFSEAAMAAVRQYRFAPGTKDGRPVAVRVPIEVVFSRR
jgi:TonB family protein